MFVEPRTDLVGDRYGVLTILSVRMISEPAPLVIQLTVEVPKEFELLVLIGFET